MSSDIQMILVVGSVHVVGLAFAAALLWHFMRASGEEGWSSDDSEGGGGGNHPVEPPSPVARAAAACRCPTRRPRPCACAVPAGGP